MGAQAALKDIEAHEPVFQYRRHRRQQIDNCDLHFSVP
jgi:hypothetical protein